MLATLENAGKRRKLLATRENAGKRGSLFQLTKTAMAHRQAVKFLRLANHMCLFLSAPVPALSYTTMSTIFQRSDFSRKQNRYKTVWGACNPVLPKRSFRRHFKAILRPNSA